MCGPLIILALVLPIAEILILVELSDHIGFLYTLGVVTLTALMGLRFVQLQGLSMLRRLRRGAIPKEAELLEGPLLVLAAIALLLPGIITDAMGFALLLPPLRRVVARRTAQRVATVSPAMGDPSTIIVVKTHGDDSSDPWDGPPKLR